MGTPLVAPYILPHYVRHWLSYAQPFQVQVLASGFDDSVASNSLLDLKKASLASSSFCDYTFEYPSCLFLAIPGLWLGFFSRIYLASFLLTIRAVLENLLQN